MSATLSRLRALPPARRRLVLEAVFALGVAALAIALVPFRHIAARAGRRPLRGPAGEAERADLARQVGWAVAACARRVPWRSKCFEQGLAAQWMLRRRQVAATLYYGVAKGEEGALTAHVWLRAGATDVIGCENKDDFAELARFPAAP